MEETIFEIHPSLSLVKIMYILSVIFFLASTFTYIFPINFKVSLPPVYLPILLAIVGIGILMVALMGQLANSFTIYALTADYFKVRVGFIGQTETLIPLSKIQSVSSSYSLTKNMMSTGDIIIRSAEEGLQGDIMLINIDNPEERKNQIMYAINLIDDYVIHHD